MALSPEPLNQARYQAETDRLRKAWEEGLESGPFASFDIEDIKQKARVRLGGNPDLENCR
ncbi:hypothetical protein EOD23_30675 [Mesorhizobium sp. USDA-HM6]|nr:hypothetical protein EOD23_30675 [Mesorhizobium sp. USDA-HM6]